MANQNSKDLAAFKIRLKIGAASSVAAGALGLLLFPSSGLAGSTFPTSFSTTTCLLVPNNQVQCDGSQPTSVTDASAKSLCSNSFKTSPSSFVPYLQVRNYSCNNGSATASANNVNVQAPAAMAQGSVGGSSAPGSAIGVTAAVGSAGAVVGSAPSLSQQAQAATANQNKADTTDSNAWQTAESTQSTADSLAAIAKSTGNPQDQKAAADAQVTANNANTAALQADAAQSQANTTAIAANQAINQAGPQTGGTTAANQGSTGGTGSQPTAAAASALAPGTTTTTDISGAPTNNNPQTAQGGKTTNSKVANTADHDSLDDNCATGSKFSGNYSCKSTRDLMTTAKITNSVGQMAGSTALNVVGQNAQQNAYATGASVSQLYQDSANMQATAAKTQMALGAANMMMGYLQNKAGAQHAKDAAALQAMNYNASKSVTTAGPGVAAATNYTITATGDQNIAQAGLTSYSKKDDNLRLGQQSAATGAVQDYNSVTSAKNTAMLEQQGVAKDAKASGFNGMLMAGQQMLAGGMSLLQADQLKKLYAEMANQPNAAPSGADTFSTLASNGSGGTITGDGTSSTSGASAATASPTPMASTPFGAPIGSPADNSLAGTAPAAQAGGAAAQPAAGGGGGAMGGSVGTGPAAPDQTADAAPKYAPQVAGAAYNGQGFAASAGSGKNGNPDNTVNSKDVMAEMMAAMMGKKDDPQLGQGILAYRSPASDTPFAPLPKSEEMFGYIHKAYQNLQTNKRIGG